MCGACDKSFSRQEDATTHFNVSYENANVVNDNDSKKSKCSECNKISEVIAQKENALKNLKIFFFFLFQARQKKY